MKKIKILLFVSSHCPHCPSAEHVVKKVVKDYCEYGISFSKIRIKTSEGKELSSRYGIMATPSIIILENGNETQRIVGVPSENGLRNKIEKSLGLKKSFLSKIFGRR